MEDIICGVLAIGFAILWGVYHESPMSDGEVAETIAEADYQAALRRERGES